MQETALSSQSCHNPWTGSHRPWGETPPDHRMFAEQRESIEGSTQSSTTAPGTMHRQGGQWSPQCYPAGERQVPPVSVSAPSSTPSETPHAECALPLRQSSLAILCQTCSCPGTPQNDYSPPIPLLKHRRCPQPPHTASPPWQQHCRTPSCTAAPLCSLL